MQRRPAGMGAHGIIPPTARGWWGAGGGGYAARSRPEKKKTPVRGPVGIPPPVDGEANTKQAVSLAQGGMRLSRAPALEVPMSSSEVAVLHARHCRGCERSFFICCGCDRGHRYGSRGCSETAVRQRRREAKRRLPASQGRPKCPDFYGLGGPVTSPPPVLAGCQKRRDSGSQASAEARRQSLLTSIRQADARLRRADDAERPTPAVSHRRNSALSNRRRHPVGETLSGGRDSCEGTRFRVDRRKLWSTRSH